MTKGLIGVIVPVYKVEKYIAECIESILAQTYTKFRLILVDDGTPDNAGKICDEYAKKDSRITVIHQENAGVTRARARGVEEASDCEFITFVDGDDTITSFYLEQLYGAISDDVDIVLNESNKGTNNVPVCKYLNDLIGEKGNMNVGPWNKLFRRILFKKETFDIPRNIVIGEDMLMNIRLAFASTKKLIAVTNKPDTYLYRKNENSITHSFKSSPEYENLFQHHLIESIPAVHKNNYFKQTIKNRLRNFNRFWGYKYDVKGMKKTNFYIDLKKDITEWNYSLPLIDRIIFTQTNIIVRYFAINIKKVLNILHY